ncbi:hypothetical protein LguiA_035552 [Lonicera macranthoides]
MLESLPQIRDGVKKMKDAVARWEADEAVRDFSDEILFHNIFLRLSIKSLLRCKSVCKAWNHVLCDPEFIRMHFNHISRQHPHKLLIRVPGNNFYSVDYEEAISSKADRADAVTLYFPPNAYSPIPQFLGSYNGLVCMVIEHDRFDLGKKILLWNPSTRQSNFIPDPNPHIRFYHILGFAYDSSTDDYKIVRIIHTQQTCRVDMYSLKTNSWKIVKDVPPNGCEFKLCSDKHPHGFEANGFIYWLVQAGFDTWPDAFSNCLIIGFGLRDEKFTVLPFPQYKREEGFLSDPDFWTPGTQQFPWTDPGDLTVLGGCLAIFKSEADGLVVWTMKEHEKKKWDRLITLSIRTSSSLTPLCFMKNGKVLFRFYSWREEKKINITYPFSKCGFENNVRTVEC